MEKRTARAEHSLPFSRKGNQTIIAPQAVLEITLACRQRLIENPLVKASLRDGAALEIRFAQSQFLILQLADLIAQLRRRFKLEPLGRLFHFLL